MSTVDKVLQFLTSEVGLYLTGIVLAAVVALIRAKSKRAAAFLDALEKAWVYAEKKGALEGKKGSDKAAMQIEKIAQVMKTAGYTTLTTEEKEHAAVDADTKSVLAKNL